MNFDYNEEQQLLADSVRRFLTKDYSFEARKKIVASKEGWSAQVWGTLAEMGLTGLPFSPDHGGFGGGAVDLMGVMEAAGDALLVEPYLPTVVGASWSRAPAARRRRRRSCRPSSKASSLWRWRIRSGRRATTSPTPLPPRAPTARAAIRWRARSAWRSPATAPTS